MDMQNQTLSKSEIISENLMNRSKWNSVTGISTKYDDFIFL